MARKHYQKEKSNTQHSHSHTDQETGKEKRKHLTLEGQYADDMFTIISDKKRKRDRRKNYSHNLIDIYICYHIYMLPTCYIYVTHMLFFCSNE